MTLITADRITRAVLPNGLTVLVRSSPGSGSVAIHGYARVGALFDGSRPGLARFAGSALMYGTARHTAHEIAEELDGRGASLSVTPGLETTAVTGRALAGELPALLGLAAEMLTEPTFPPEEVEKIRGRLITAARVNALDTRHVAERLFRRLAYPDGHPHAQPPDGDERIMAALTPDDLRAFHARHVHPEAVLIAVVGDVDADRVVEHVAETLGPWAAGSGWTMPVFPDPQPSSTLRREEIALPGKTQSDLVLGAPGVARTDPEYYATMIGNLLLGQLGMMGRIGQNVREQKGMAYYAFSDLRAGVLAGPWWARAGVNPANVDRAVEAIIHEVRTLQHDGPAVEELADARTFLTGSLAVRLETNQGVAQTLADIELFGLGLDYLERYPSIVRGVGPDEILRAIQRFPTGAYALAVAGPEPAV